MTNRFERKIKLISEEKYKLANRLLFDYAIDNALYGEIIPHKEVSFQKEEGELSVCSDFNTQTVTIKAENLREANNLEQQLKRINIKN